MPGAPSRRRTNPSGSGGSGAVRVPTTAVQSFEGKSVVFVRTPTGFKAAFDKMRDQIDTLGREAEFGKGGEHIEVLETYKMFAYDEGWSRRINEAIDSGLTAEAAIERVIATATAEDIVLIAGKGHEVGQTVAGITHHFSDHEEVRAALTEAAR